eukprot:693256-Prorocentrum_minimum.AAC.21
MTTKQMLFVETDRESSVGTVEFFHSQAVLLNSHEDIRLTETPESKKVLEVFGDVLADRVRGRSDARLKKDVSAIPSAHALDVVERLNGRRYRFDGDWRYGLVAQEVESVLPDIVYTDQLGYKSVNYIDCIAVLVEAVKGLKAELDALKP